MSYEGVQATGAGRIRKTKVPIFLNVKEAKKRKLEKLVDKLDNTHKKHLLKNLGPFILKRSSSRRARLAEWIRPYKDPVYLGYLEKELYSEEERFKITKEASPQAQFYKIFKNSLKIDDAKYLANLLRKSLKSIYVTPKIGSLLQKIYEAHIREEFTQDKEVPKVPLMLIIGNTRSGKTATIRAGLEDYVFENEVVLRTDALDIERAKVIKQYPVRGRLMLGRVAPELNKKLREREKNSFLRTAVKIPLLGRVVKKVAKNTLAKELGKGIEVDYFDIDPQTVKTKYYGEGGHNFQKAFDSKAPMAIRIIEDAHGVLEEPGSGRLMGVDQQQEVVRSAVSRALDEIIQGKRKTIVIALTHTPDRIAKDIYGRFQQYGTIIDMNEEWNNPKEPEYVKNNLKEVIKRELLNPSIKTNPSINLDDKTLYEITGKIPRIFNERGGLTVTPAYVKRLVSTMITEKGDIKPEYFDDKFLVRECFKGVARNEFEAEFYDSIVGVMKREPWDAYEGDIKNIFAKRARAALYYAMRKKGVILVGPPGSGKTFLGQCFLSNHPEIVDISVSPGVIFNPNEPMGAAIENIKKVFTIAKMLAPSFLFMDEIDALAPKRGGAMGNVGGQDKIVNTLLNEIGGDKPFEGVYVVGTTNRIDIVDPALVRALRLDVLNVSGNLTQTNINKIIRKELQDYKKEGVTTETVYDMARDICSTPAEFIAFLNEIKDNVTLEYKVVQKLKKVYEEGTDEKKLEKFFKLNYKVMMGIFETLGINEALKKLDKEDFSGVTKEMELYRELFEPIKEMGDYPIRKRHLDRARIEYTLNPMRAGMQMMEEFLTSQLSKEPQVGFVLGMAAGETKGWYTQISTTLDYRPSATEQFDVTGMASPGIAVPEMEMGIEMTKQSAREAYSAVLNYLDSILPEDKKINVHKLIGEYLKGWVIHHQFLNPTYSGGGPSAGYAMLINTLSVLLNVPVYNDFGITGAPWSRGVTKDEVGSPIIIGGEDYKTSKALEGVRRMYLPSENLKKIPQEYLDDYWEQGKDALDIGSFRKTAPEVYSFSKDHKRKLDELVKARIEYKKSVVKKEEDLGHIRKLEGELKEMGEREMTRRVECLAKYLTDEKSDKYAHPSAIFAHYNEG